MKPIQDILNRIKWDKDFGSAKFELGYWDRVDASIHRIALGEIEYDHPEDDDFALTDAEGNRVNIPFHRVRQVWRDGELIWNRPQSGD